MYELNNALEKDIPSLKQYKLATIFEYANILNEKEKKKIVRYVDNSISKLLKEYKIIMKDNIVIGCVLKTLFRDGILLDEIYLEESYRNKGIGSDNIKKLVDNHPIIYLWVYKNNKKAINLYRKFNFESKEETEDRYLMMYKLRLS